MTLSWSHAVLNVRDLDTMLDFYTDVLQFEVVKHRLMDEYGVDCAFEAVNVTTARWVECDDDKELDRFKARQTTNLALDHAGDLAYIAPTRVNLDMTVEKWPEIKFLSTREHGIYN